MANENGPLEILLLADPAAVLQVPSMPGIQRGIQNQDGRASRFRGPMGKAAGVQGMFGIVMDNFIHIEAMKEISFPDAHRFIQSQIADWRSGWTDRSGPNKGKMVEPVAVEAVATLQFIAKHLPKTKREAIRTTARRIR